MLSPTLMVLNTINYGVVTSSKEVYCTSVEYHKLWSSYKKPVSVRNHEYNIKYKKLNVVTRHK